MIIDQFIDSRDGFNKVAAAGGFKFVVAESSVYFDSINVKRLAAPLTVVPCSEVDDSDLQRIIDAIPLDVKRFNVQDRNFKDETDNRGLFEGLVAHVYDKELTARFRERLAEFEHRDQQAFDVYMMACYVNQCRTLVSYDMMHMFIGSPDYVDGYRVADRIKQFIHEQDVDPYQDHFSVRSSALARIAYKVSSRAAFGRVYRRFHQAISNLVIPDYKTFRKYAYDNDFAVKAFPDPKDGKAFYERLFSIADNPYDYQHGAVYMSKLKQHAVAFDWIDRALSKSGGRIFVIRNSHAVILFEANIDIYNANRNDHTALDGLRQSMDVLEKLIEQDNWRRYHLLRFADQAKKMAAIDLTDEVKRWLDSAASKLRSAVDEALRSGSRESYNTKKYQRLLRDIEQALLT